MDGNGPVVAVALVMAATAVLSGPLVGAVDLTTASDRPVVGQGSVTVESVTFPANATLTDARFGAGGYYLRVPPATVELGSVTGYPRLLYEIAVDRLGYSLSALYTLSPGATGTRELALPEGSIGTDDVDAEAYEATLSIAHMTNGTERELASRRITVEVVG